LQEDEAVVQDSELATDSVVPDIDNVYILAIPFYRHFYYTNLEKLKLLTVKTIKQTNKPL